MFDFNYFHSWDIKYLFIFLLLLLLVSFLGNRKIIKFIYSFVISSISTFLILSLYIYISYYPNLIRYYYNISEYNKVTKLYNSYEKLRVTILDELFFNKEKRNEIKDIYIMSLFFSNSYKKVLPYLEERYYNAENKSKVFWGIYLSYSYFYLQNFRKSSRIYYNSSLLALSILSQSELSFFKNEIALLYYHFY